MDGKGVSDQDCTQHGLVDAIFVSSVARSLRGVLQVPRCLCKSAIDVVRVRVIKSFEIVLIKARSARSSQRLRVESWEGAECEGLFQTFGYILSSSHSQYRYVHIQPSSFSIHTATISRLSHSSCYLCDAKSNPVAAGSGLTSIIVLRKSRFRAPSAFCR